MYIRCVHFYEENTDCLQNPWQQQLLLLSVGFCLDFIQWLSLYVSVSNGVGMLINQKPATLSDAGSNMLERDKSWRLNLCTLGWGCFRLDSAHRSAGLRTESQKMLPGATGAN